MYCNIIGIVFSKDRAMQLDATLRSFSLKCQDGNRISLTVLYSTSTIRYEALYKSMRTEYRSIQFVKETGFRKDVLTLMAPFDYVLFLVDDNIFVREFSLSDALLTIAAQPDSIGFSLRLGKNTTYCYPMDSIQKVPQFHELGSGILKYDWVGSELDFGYPLEVSSSIYRVRDLLPQLKKLRFTNPSTLEVQLDAIKHRYALTKPSLFCYEQSITFCAPLNLTQTTYPNRVGHYGSYGIDSLAMMFENGKRIDVNSFTGFVPNACHQEVELSFIQAETRVPKLSTIEHLTWVWLRTSLFARAGSRRISKATKYLTTRDTKLSLRAKLGYILEALGLEREVACFRRNFLGNQRKAPNHSENGAIRRDDL